MAAVRQLIRPFQLKIIGWLTRSWPPYSRLFFPSDKSRWVIWWERRELIEIAKKLKYRVSRFAYPPRGMNRQTVYFGGPYFLIGKDWLNGNHRIGFDFFHGQTEVNDTFRLLFDRLKKKHSRIHRVRVSNSTMRYAVLEMGIDSQKVHTIPIGINLDYFPRRTEAMRKMARKNLGLPNSAVIVGSFQKDGEGWGQGETPKLIKGPDIFVQAMKILHERIPEVFVLLSGPARGYVKKKLYASRIPFKHVYVKHYPDIRKFYHALDIYMITSRIEGGPKAILESMACGIPLVTTKVGQAIDLVQHGRNAWMVETEDVEGLAYWAEYSLTNQQERQQVLEDGRRTAIENTYNSQLPLWKDFYMGFVEPGFK